MKDKEIKLPRPKAILFDWDNTLVDTWPIIHNALTETFNKFEMKPWTMQETKKNVHRSMRDSFPDIFGENWKIASEIYYESFLANHLKKLRIIPHSDEVLQILIDTDIYIAVVSNKTGKHLRTEVNHIGWEKYFNKIVGATDAPEDKPSPAPVLMALDGSNIKPSEEVWLIGDSITDLQCAVNSGCKPIFFGDSELPKEFLETKKDSETTVHLKTHKDLIKVIKDY